MINMKSTILITLLIFSSSLLFIINNKKDDFITITIGDNLIENNVISDPDISNEPLLVNNFVTEQVSEPTVTEQVSEPTVTEQVSPITMSDKYKGVFSLDLHSIESVYVGATIIVSTPYGDNEMTIDDIYYEEGKKIITFNGDNHSEGSVIYFPSSGNSFVRMSSEHLVFETNLNSNGVGEFINAMEFLKEGRRYNSDDTVYFDDEGS